MPPRRKKLFLRKPRSEKKIVKNFLPAITFLFVLVSPVFCQDYELLRQYLERAGKEETEVQEVVPAEKLPLFSDTLRFEAKKAEEIKKARVEEEKLPYFDEYIVINGDTVQTIRKATPRELTLYGSSFFERQQEGAVYMGDSPAPQNYRLGPGDEIIINLWGGVSASYSLSVDRDGKIVIPQAGALSMAGLTLGAAKNVIASHLKKIYSDFQLDVALGKVKAIRVYVIGDVKYPGGYTLNGLANVVNALEMAGGIGEHGSLRDIRIIQAGRIRHRLDLYMLIQEGKLEKEIFLLPNDIIYVPPARGWVSVRGRVKRPAIYEIAGTEKMSDILSLAGGTLPDADIQHIMVDRIEKGEHRIVTVDSSDTDAVLFGDDISVFPIDYTRRRLVFLEGNVNISGCFELKEGMRVSDLIGDGEFLLEDTYLKRADLIRLLPSQKRELIAVDLGAVLAGDEKENLLLKEDDRLIVYSVWDVQRKDYVSIDGMVFSPGKFELFENMRVSDLVFEAGGLLKKAYTGRAELSRVYPGEDSTEVIYIDLEKALKGDPQEDVLLQPDDYLFIREVPGWKLQEIVTVLGEVNFPGNYAIVRKEEKLSELIERAGGFTNDAYIKGAVFVRPSITEEAVRRDLRRIVENTQEAIIDSLGNIQRVPLLYTFREENLNRVIINLEKIVKGDKKEDIVLQDGDTIFIPRKPSGVSVLGSVASTGTIKYIKGKNVGYYLEKAGGFTRNADKGEIRLVKASGKVIKCGLRFRDIEPGDAIVVPQTVKKKTDWGKILQDSITIVSGLATTLYIILKL